MRKFANFEKFETCQESASHPRRRRSSRRTQVLHVRDRNDENSVKHSLESSSLGADDGQNDQIFKTMLLATGIKFSHNKISFQTKRGEVGEHGATHSLNRIF